MRSGRAKNRVIGAKKAAWSRPWKHLLLFPPVEGDFGTSGNQQHGNAVRVGVYNTRGSVRGAGPRDGERNPDFARRAGIPVGEERCAQFVSDEVMIDTAGA